MYASIRYKKMSWVKMDCKKRKRKEEGKWKKVKQYL